MGNRGWSCQILPVFSDESAKFCAEEGSSLGGMAAAAGGYWDLEALSQWKSYAARLRLGWQRRDCNGEDDLWRE